jgi:hypothetical protein
MEGMRTLTYAGFIMKCELLNNELSYLTINVTYTTAFQVRRGDFGIEPELKF